jgi:hypothetical protein
MATHVAMRPAGSVHGSCKSSFSGLTASLQRLTVAPKEVRPLTLTVQGRCPFHAALAAMGTVGSELVPLDWEGPALC